MNWADNCSSGVHGVPYRPLTIPTPEVSSSMNILEEFATGSIAIVNPVTSGSTTFTFFTLLSSTTSC
jgi:hypothetical protein